MKRSKIETRDIFSLKLQKMKSEIDSRNKKAYLQKS